MTTTKVAAAVLSGALLATAAPGLAASSSTVATRQTKLGRILVDAHGRTLYLFEKDRHGKSSCASACAKEWPPVLSKSKPTAGKAASAKLLGTTRRSDGTTQVTYKGHPLYRFSGDMKPGQTGGEGLRAFGAEWYVLSARGTKVDKS